MLVACLELSLCFVVAVSAWQVLKGRNVALFVAPLKYALVMLAVTAAAQIWLGDKLGENTLENKPAALAAMEGHYDSHDAAGNVNSAWHVIGWPNKDGTGLAWSIDIPHALSLIETKSWNDPVTGLNAFPKEDQPPVAIMFYTFRLMVAAGGAILLMALWGIWLMRRGAFSVTRLPEQKWFLRLSIAMLALPYLSVVVGWWTREIGRQPWVVYGMMRTQDGVSHMSVPLALFWFIGFAIFEIAVTAATFYYLRKVADHGPDMDSPLPGEGHERLGHLDRATGDQPEYIRPV